MFGSILETLRAQRPLVHNITNYVTANDCANIVLACGASPIMADDPQEAAQITAGCRGLNLNLGTLSQPRLTAMLRSGQQANAQGIPIVLDPVGVGASDFRMEAAQALLRQVRFTAIRGNLSEIKALYLGCGSGGGVDTADAIQEDALEDSIALAKAMSQQTGAVTALTGVIDIVTDGCRTYCIRNGHPMMSTVTGAGCQLTALMAAFLAAAPDKPLDAAADAVCAMGLAGELAARRLTPLDGNASYRNYLIDAVFNLTPQQLQEGANYEMR